MRSPPIPLFCILCVPSVRQPRLPFCDMKLTLFCVSTASGLLHDVFQRVSAHPIPIEICYGMLTDAKITSTLLTCFVNDILDVASDISRLQSVRNRKVLSTS